MIHTLQKPTKKIVPERVCAYVRVSTDEPDQLDSFEAQESHYTSLIQSNPAWAFSGIYSDEGISGTKTKHRLGLQEMMEDARSYKFDLILTKSLSRFARNTVDALSLIRELMELGIAIHFEKENINTESMESELMLSIMASLAEEESHSISENLKWSLQKSFRDGSFLPSYLPYGYYYQDGVITIQEEEAAVVYSLFLKSNNGYGAFRLAKELNRKGIPCRRGETWNESTILGMLKNEFYTGKLLCQKTYTDERFIRHRNKGQKEQFLIDNHHPAIVDQVLFDAVQKKIKLRRKHTQKTTKVYPFTGKLRCKECGTNYRRRTHTCGYRTPIHWTCANHIRSMTLCSQKAVAEYKIEWAFLTMMNKLQFAREQIIQPLLDSSNKDTGQDDRENIQNLQKELRDIMRELQTLENLKWQGLLNDKHFQNRKRVLQEEKKKKEWLLEEQSTREKETSCQLGDLRWLDLALKQEQSFTEFDKLLFREVVDYAEIYERQAITFHLACGLKLKEDL